MSNDDPRRCINQKCASNRKCALFVKDRRPHEKIIYGMATLGQCDEFDALHQEWGAGAEPND